METTVLHKPSVRELTPLHKLKNSIAPIKASAIARDNTHAVTIGADDFLCLWDIKQGKLIRKFTAQTSKAVAFFPDGNRVLLGTDDDDSAFGVWNIERRIACEGAFGPQGRDPRGLVSSDSKNGLHIGR